jgi:hypothetical protein
VLNSAEFNSPYDPNEDVEFSHDKSDSDSQAESMAPDPEIVELSDDEEDRFLDVGHDDVRRGLEAGLGIGGLRRITGAGDAVGGTPELDGGDYLTEEELLWVIRQVDPDVSRSVSWYCLASLSVQYQSMVSGTHRGILEQVVLTEGSTRRTYLPLVTRQHHILNWFRMAMKRVPVRVSRGSAVDLAMSCATQWTSAFAALAPTGGAIPVVRSFYQGLECYVEYVRLRNSTGESAKARSDFLGWFHFFVKAGTESSEEFSLDSSASVLDYLGLPRDAVATEPKGHICPSCVGSFMGPMCQLFLRDSI